MILRIFKGNQPYLLFLIPLIAIGLWFPHFWEVLKNPEIQIQPESQMPLYQFIITNLNNIYLQYTVAFTLLIFQAFWINHLNFRFRFIDTQTYLPALLFIFISSTFVEFEYLHPMLIANFFLIMALDRILLTYRKDNALSNFFEASLLMGIGSLICFPVIFYFPVIYISILILRQFHWREWIIPVLGLITPYFFTWVYYFFFELDFQYLINILRNQFSVSIISIRLNVITLSLLVFLGILIIFSLYILIRYRNFKIRTRKYIQVIIWMFVLSVVYVVFIDSATLEFTYPIALPIAIMLSNYFISVRTKWIGNLFFTLLFALIIAVQVFV